jgi:hypothetical protein
MNAKKDRMRRGSKLSQPPVEDAVCLEEREFKQTFSKRNRAIKGVVINLFYPALLAVALYNLTTYIIHDLSLMFQYRSFMFVLVIIHFCLNYLFLYKNSSYYNVHGAGGWGWLLFAADLGVIYLFTRLSFSMLSQEIVTNSSLSSMLSMTFVKIYGLLLVWEIIRDEIRQVSNPNRGNQFKRLLKNPYLRHMLVGIVLFYLLHASQTLLALALIMILVHYLFLIVKDLRQKLVIA